MKYYSILLFVFFFSHSFAQNFTISGYVRDDDSGESLIGATLLNARNQSGTSVNSHGFYSITLPHDSVSLMISFVGYTAQIVKFNLSGDTTINFALRGSTQLDEVVVTSTRADAIHDATRMSTVTVPIEQIKSLPAFLGEVDILKVIQLLPGVQSSEGSTGIYVRGGGPDQNLMLLDGVPVYNASHLFGFFSIFNSDAINHVELTKGGFPARYGGRLSSVLDINMKEGNMKKVKGEGSVGLIATRFTIEAPLKKDKSSFILSGRRTYIDILAQPFIRKQSYGSRAGYYFYDFNFKFNQIINQNNRFYISTYFGSDKAYARDQSSDENTYINPPERTDSKSSAKLQWGNVIATMRWSHVISPKLFSNAMLSYSRYLFGIGGQSETWNYTGSDLKEYSMYSTKYHSGIRDWAAKVDLDYLPNPDHYIKLGFHNTQHRFSPGVLNYSSTEKDTLAGASVTDANEMSLYAEDDWRISEKLKANVGVHTSLFYVDNVWYHSIQPRLSLRFLLSDDLSLKGSYSSMTQYIHLLTNAGIGLPTDLWVSSTGRVQPQRGNQVALGVARTYQSRFEVSIEGYYKMMHHLIDYKEGASYLNTSADWQDKVATNGVAKSYGVEFLFQKKTGKTTGWLGYTLSKSTRQYAELNFGKVFPYKYDRRHDVSLTVTHQLKKNIECSLVWVFGTGNAITLPVEVYAIGRHDIMSEIMTPSPEKLVYYGSRNSFRMHSYHRLDLSISWSKQKKWGIRKWSIGIYNAYNRKNPFFITSEKGQGATQQFVQYSLFPIIPSFTYNFKF